MILFRCSCATEFAPTRETTIILPIFPKPQLEEMLISPEIQKKASQICKIEFGNEGQKYKTLTLYEETDDDPYFKILALYRKEVFKIEHEKDQQDNIAQICEAIFKELAEKESSQILVPVSQILKPFSSGNTDHDVAFFIEMFLRCLHQLIDQSDRFKSDALSTPLSSLKEIVFIIDPQAIATASKACQRAQAIVKGMALTQKLANLPPNFCTPEFLHQEALRLSNDKPKHLSLTVHDQAALESMKMNGILNVAAGSRYPAYLLEMRYHPPSAPSDASPIVLVGKGITFDSGGLSLKPSNAMEQMKYDMCGAATVFGVLEGLSELQVELPVVGLVPVCENMVSQNSYRPGDILTLYSGLTIEIGNTDAEGRLILADALAYAEKQLNPKEIIDIATLTGACVIALGSPRSGLFCTNERLKTQLFTISEKVRDKVWPMPMDQDYDTFFSSSAADWSNCGKTRGAGAITAARFLSKFVKNTPWAHLDVAATAYAETGRIRATGRPVPLLLHYLIECARVL